jgi:hypothetical protein
MRSRQTTTMTSSRFKFIKISTSSKGKRSFFLDPFGSQIPRAFKRFDSEMFTIRLAIAFDSF